MTAHLEARGLEAGWERQPVIRDLDLDVAGGEVVAILGENGSGKSTLLWALAGLLPVRRGSIHLDGVTVTGLSTPRRAAHGLHLLPQTRRVFPSLTVRQNLEAAALAVGRPSLADIRRRTAVWLERFPRLAATLDEPAARLSGGEQQQLAIARVLSTAPRVLLLDEPSAGLAPGAAQTCAAIFAELATDGVAVVLVEQNVDLARRIATRTLVLHDGRTAPAPHAYDRR